MSYLVLVLALVLAACSGRGPKPWPGYAEGKDAFVSASQPGWIDSIAVKPGQTVKKGTVLFTLDDAKQPALRDEAEVTLREAKAQAAKAEAQLLQARQKLAHDKSVIAGAASRSARDSARNDSQELLTQIAQFKAQAQQARATIGSAEDQLSQRPIRTRVGGRVENVYYHRGEYVPASTPVVSLLPPQNVFVRFFVPQKQFANVRMGQKVAISCDGCASHMTAKITFIAAQEQYAPAAFSIPNREQLVFKLEARTPDGLPLKPGQSVDVRPLQARSGS